MGFVLWYQDHVTVTFSDITVQLQINRMGTSLTSHTVMIKLISTMCRAFQGAVLFDGEPLEDVHKFKLVDFIFIANGQGTEEIKSRINLTRSAFSLSDRGVKRRFVQRAGSTRQCCDRFCSTVAKRGQHGWPTKRRCQCMVWFCVF